MTVLDSRLVSMETMTRSIGGRSVRASHNSSSPTGVSVEEAFAQRQKLQLGSEFQVIGDLRNWTRYWSHDVSSTVEYTDFTRVLCLNVGGSSGTLIVTTRRIVSPLSVVTT